MSTILEKIINEKKREVSERKAIVPIKKLEAASHFSAPAVSLRSYLERKDLVGIIAEFKRKSPSKGWINPHAVVEQTSIGYMQAGASALSILTDEMFFGGTSGDLAMARRFNYCPILRKDFIIDEYQIVEAKSIGADAILLIAACLSENQISSFTAQSRQLGMEVLLEIHSLDEVPLSIDSKTIIGVNNRDLRDFTVDIDRSLRIAEALPKEAIKVAESGISESKTVKLLKENGFSGFLMGEHFMRSALPEEACHAFIAACKRELASVQ